MSKCAENSPTEGYQFSHSWYADSPKYVRFPNDFTPLSPYGKPPPFKFFPSKVFKISRSFAGQRQLFNTKLLQPQFIQKLIFL